MHKYIMYIYIRIYIYRVYTVSMIIYIYIHQYICTVYLSGGQAFFQPFSTQPPMQPAVGAPGGVGVLMDLPTYTNSKWRFTIAT